MKQFASPLLAIAIMLLPIFSFAQTTIDLISFEDQSCGTWFKSAKDRSRAREAYISWFRGFVTGYNFGNPNKQVRGDAMPNDATLVLYIDKFCRENPLNGFTVAAFRLVEEIRER